jgi:hypothetical protein
MRKIMKNKAGGEKFLLQASAFLFLLGFLLYVAPPEALAEQLDPCDAAHTYPASRTKTQLVNTQTNQPMGNSYFDVYRTGSKILDVDVAIDLLDTTILKVYLNGVLLGTMESYNFDGQEHWALFVWDESAPVVRVGDEIIITKDVVPLFTGKFVRQSYDWGYVGGYVRHTVGPWYSECSTLRGYIYLPNSIYRRYLLISPRVLTPVPVTRITVNGPSFYPGGIGDEIAEVPIVSSAPSNQIPTWYRTTANNDSIGLSVEQYQQLRQGLLTINVFTAQHPSGFSQIPLKIFLLNASGDFEGDGQADLAVFRPSDQNWYLLYSSNNEFHSVRFGLPTDKLVIGDYDSDGKTDITAFQIDNPDYPGLGVWQILNSASGNMSTIRWGLFDDIPLSMNIDGNNTSDLAVFRPSNGTWYILRMGDIIKPRTGDIAPQNGINYRIIQWGAAGDKPLAGDFNADGIDELVAFRPANGDWYIYDDVTATYQVLHWGANGDIPIARDFDGDARADLAVYRPSNGTWYIRSSLDNSLIARQFGVNGDIPVPADFDKDGATDIAVFRPSNGTWYVIHSSNNLFVASQFGANGDVPAMGQR